ncbi:MAG: acyl carrier protein [Bacteroidota bacterium]
MDRIEVVNKLTEIFRTVFNQNSLVLTNELTANDIDRWDSLSHMILINEIENAFTIKFKLKDLNKMRNVGDMIDVIITKL